MTFTSQDMQKLETLMNQSSENRELLQKLLDYHQYCLSQVSHEIRNPLALVYSTLQLIESTHPEVLTIRHWDHLRNDIEYMKVLLEELSKYNNGDHVSMETLNLRPFLKRIVLSFAASLTDTDIEFTSRIDPAIPTINGDKIKLQELLLNLLRNAKDAVHPTGSITLSAYLKDKEVVIEISDTGCGIPEEHLETIFSPFVTHKKDGTGLGLAIVQKAIAAHAGTIVVDSEPGIGTKFTVGLPIQHDC